MAHPVTPPRVLQAPPVAPGAPNRPIKKQVPIDPEFKSRRILFPEPEGKAAEVASTIEGIAARIHKTRLG